MLSEKDPGKCTGCYACVNVCPVECIGMAVDDKGFQTPRIDRDRCIHCGACEEVCSRANGENTNMAEPVAFGVISKDEVLRRDSSSGGVFSLLAKQVLSRGGIVFGAVLSEDCKSVHHALCADEASLATMRGAKYLQSDIHETYREAREHLKSGKSILFSGTPCQIDGLKAFLNCDYANLLCVDFICHGVPSPMIWKKYCNEIEKEQRGTIVDAKFRHKKYNWDRFSLGVKVRDRHYMFKSKVEDPYLRLFLSDYTLRPSCYQCLHKGVSRQSDITLADFWGVAEVAPDLYDRKGTSLVLIHTKKGMNVFESIKGETIVKEVNAREAVEHNTAATESSCVPKDYDKFWDDVKRHSVSQLADKYCPISIKTRMKAIVAQSKIYSKMRGGGNV